MSDMYLTGAYNDLLSELSHDKNLKGIKRQNNIF